MEHPQYTVLRLLLVGGLAVLVMVGVHASDSKVERNGDGGDMGEARGGDLE